MPNIISKVYHTITHAGARPEMPESLQRKVQEAIIRQLDGNCLIYRPQCLIAKTGRCEIRNLPPCLLT